MPDYSLHDLQQAAPRVLERLRALADIPPFGTVAGQSVASLFLEELGHPVRGQVNDIDIFVSSGMPRTMRGLADLDPNRPYTANPRRQGTTTHFGDVSSETDYQHVKFIALRSSVSILRTYKVGLVNFTLIDSPLIKHNSPTHGDVVSQSVVDGFDLNLVGVGINLDTGKVVVSPGFLEFLATSRIRVETCNTPAHTMVRLAKKVLGGEVSGAVCDYPVERQMLEVALHCQYANLRRAENASSEHRLHAVQGFGARYKQLYDTYAHALPGIVSEDKTLPDQTTYTFYDLVPADPTLPADLHLADLAAGDISLSYPISQLIHVAHFPRIYELFHPERALLPEHEIQARRDAFARIDPQASDGTNLHWLMQALGRPSVHPSVQGLDENDVAEFFFGQACAKDPAMSQALAADMENIPPLERAIIHAGRHRADIVHAFLQDRTEGWRSMMRATGEQLLSSAARVNLPSEEPYRPALLRELLAVTESMGSRGREIHHALVPCHRKDGEHGFILVDLLKCFDPADRPALAWDLFAKVLPGFPLLDAVEPKVAARACMLWKKAGQPLDTMWKDLPAPVMPLLADALFAEYRTVMHTPSSAAPWAAEVERLLEGLTDGDLLAERGRLIRAALEVQAFEVLRERLLRVQDQAGLSKVLDQTAKKLRAQKGRALFAYLGNDAEDRWKNSTHPLESLSAIEQLQLELDCRTRPPLAPRRPTRF